MADKLGEDDLKALVANEIRASIAYADTGLSAKRATAIDYYQGRMTDVPAEVGRSSSVSRDVADTIGWMLPGIVRVFTASDQMAVCEPVRPSDEPYSSQASDGINYVFWKDNPGYRTLYDATHDSLLQGNGIVKHWWDDTEEAEVSEHTGLSDDQLIKLLGEDEDGIEVLAHTMSTETEEAEDPATGMPVSVETQIHDVTIKRTKNSCRVRVECIPPETFLLDRDARTIEEARFIGHRDRVTRSDLIEMGFARDKVETLAASIPDMAEEIARGDEARHGSGVGHASMTLVDLTECYVRADVDGDGLAETVRCYYAGGKEAGVLLEWEVWEDEVPFSDIPCNPMPHRWDADSIADETMDVQRIKTVLQRQALDNLYATNIPQRFAKGDFINQDELFNPSFGGVVFGKANAELQNIDVPFVANHAFDAINYQDQVIERRTGVSRTMMALDPEALQNQTATANQNAKDAAYSQIELIARNQAELGWKRVFRSILRLMVKHQDKARTVRLRDKWVEIDPRSWNADMDVTINVGLGTGSRDRDMQMLNVILQSQTNLVDRLQGAGLTDEALEMLPLIRNTLAKITESAGMKSPEQFFPEIGPEVIEAMKKKLAEQSQAGDPKAAAEAQKMQAEQQAQAAQLQFDMQKEQARMQFEGQQAQAKMQADAEGRQADFALRREQLAAEMALKREQLSAELQLKRESMAADLQLRRELGHIGAAVKIGAATSGVHVGGEPG